MSTNQFRRYLDLLNEADLVPPNTNVALPSSGTFSNDDAIANLNRQMAGGNEPRCAFCGTPQGQHQQLQHQFVAGNDTQPAPVAQGGSSSGDISRIKQLQRELLAAGAALGRTGANRDGIDGDIGPLTRAAMIKYPDISAKYADLSADPAAQASTPAVDTSKLTSALDAIESIIKKYKGKAKVSESKIYEVKRKTNSTPPSFTQDEIDRMTARPSAAAPAAAPAAANPNESPEQKRIRLQKAAQAGIDSSRASSTKPPQPPSIYDRFNKPSGAPVELAKVQPYTQAAATAEKGLLKGAGKLAGKAVPFVGAGLSLKDAYDRWQAGDKTGAVISTLAGAGWLVPGPAGWVLGGGLDAYNLYRGDQTGAQAVSSEDVAAIQQNLKIINDWSQIPENAASITPELKSRIADATAAGVALTKQAAAGADSPTTPAQTPAQTSTPATTNKVPPPALKDTVDKLDKLLKKNSFESREPRTLSEQLARDRDIVNEGLGDVAKWAGKNVIAPTAKFAWDKAIKPTANFAWNDVIKPSGNAVISGTINNVIAPAARLATQAATLGGIGYGSYKAWEYMHAPKTMSTEDQAEFNSLLADYKKMVPDQAAFDALPPDVQEKLIAIANRVQNMEQQGNK